MGCNRLGTEEDKAAVLKEVAIAEARCHAPDLSGNEVQSAFERGGMPAVLALQAAREAERMSKYTLVNQQLDQSAREQAAREQAARVEAAREQAERERITKEQDERLARSLTQNTYDPMMRNAKENTWFKLADKAIGMRTSDGVVHIKSVVGEATERSGFERLLLPGIKVGLEGYQRAHPHGPGTGQEVATGILYAPAVVNQELQNHGLEKHIRDLRDRVDGVYQLVLKTETEARSGTLELSRITYRLEFHGLDADPLTSTPLGVQEAEIRIEGTSKKPHITFDPWETV